VSIREFLRVANKKEEEGEGWGMREIPKYERICDKKILTCMHEW